jgi:hypothetical protein
MRIEESQVLHIPHFSQEVRSIKKPITRPYSDPRSDSTTGQSRSHRARRSRGSNCSQVTDRNGMVDNAQ